MNLSAHLFAFASLSCHCASLVCLAVRNYLHLIKIPDTTSASPFSTVFDATAGVLFRLCWQHHPSRLCVSFHSHAYRLYSHASIKNGQQVFISRASAFAPQRFAAALRPHSSSLARRGSVAFDADFDIVEVPQLRVMMTERN